MPALLRRPLALVVVGLVIVGGACSKGDGDGDDVARQRATTTSAPAPLTPSFTISGIEPNGTTPPDEATVAAVKRAIDGWAVTAVVTPLQTGAPAGDLSGSFTGAALARLGDPAVRATLVDEGLPPATTSLRVDTSTAALSSVADASGAVGVIVAAVDLRVHAVGPTSDVEVVHQGDVVLVPDGETWKIDSFSLRTTRDSRP